ncbi:5e753a44-6a39-4526-a3ac-a6231d2182f0 [Sclerotinia trifoliorum]|uniref:5e753a44-6a39-4526-a3ac-a6231d2182f0 n=1 Tax=Sclerotinia trifoliorum TaxID=28548 RepID=A0A8H2W3E8_9HELO|nr:5e753a44-6a39-4526-a3ac-a6231d2182f0 [Sclerotinia trifoliorum]
MMNYQQDESIKDLNAALQKVLLAFPGNSGHQIIQDTVKRAINASGSTPACIQTEEESKHFDQLRNFIDNLVLTVTPQALPPSTATRNASHPSNSEHNKRKSLDDPEHDARLSRRKLSKAEQEAAGALQELSAGV